MLYTSLFYTVFQLNLATSMISLKMFKNHLSFHARFLFFFSPSRFSPLHCPLHDHWYSAK